MFDALYEFFFFNIFNWNEIGNYDNVANFFFLTNIDGETISLAEYFSLLCSYISIIFIFVLCCLFVYKIIRLVGGLISR